MSPTEELLRAAGRVLTSTDREIAKVERWLSGEEDEATIMGLSAELERLTEERDTVATIQQSLRKEEE